MAGETKGKAVENFKGVNGHSVTPRSQRTKPRRSFFMWLFSTGTWLLTWYSIITVIFQCPESVDLITDASPRICKPYFQAKSTLAPYATPYYDTYAAPYVDSARPYYNVLDKNVITPATFYGKKYGAPRVAQAQAIGKEQWEKQIQPQVAKLNKLAQDQYDKTLAPHVQTAAAATVPYAKFAKENALQTYYASILPAYAAVEPYAQQAYGVGKTFTVNTGIPYAQWAWTSGVAFLDRTIWPKARILYGENVEPQLIRIGERLGRYRDGKKLQSIVDEVESSTSSSSATPSSEPPTTESTVVSSASSETPTATATQEEVAPTPLTEAEQRAIAQKIVEEDLRTWQEKFAKAADQGSDELEARITEITDRAVNKQAHGVGEAHLVQLEETVKSQIQSFKTAIMAIVRLQGEEEHINGATRKAGLAIRDKAQAVREWRHSFDQETNELASKASEDTFKIIDHIRDLGLQEIGMRWAWTDGITHKDWAKYHALKSKFDEWRRDVEEVVTGHPGLQAARAASEDIESRAMAVAEDSAKELSRLKETGRWKLAMSDASDDFSTHVLPPAAAAAAQKVAEKVREASEAIVGSAETSSESPLDAASSTVVEAGSSIAGSASSVADNVKSYASEVTESVASAASSVSDNIASAASSVSDNVVSAASSVTDNVASAASAVSEGVAGSSQGSAESFVSAAQASVESVVSVAQESAESFAEKASSAVIGTSQGTVESASSVVSGSASSLLDKASSAVIGTSQGTVESASSVVSGSASSLLDKASSAVIGTSQGTVESASSVVSESASSILEKASSSAEEVLETVSAAVSSATSVVKDAVPTASDEQESYSEKIQNLAGEAGERIADVTEAISEALLKQSTQGNVESATSAAAEQYSSVLSAASAAVYGEEKGAAENMASVVSEKYAEASSAASTAVYGTPTPVESVIAQASAAFDALTSQAEERLSRASAVVSGMIQGTPKPVHEKMFSSVEAAYSDSVAQASQRLESVISAASEAAQSATSGVEDFASSVSSAVSSSETKGLCKSVARLLHGIHEVMIDEAIRYISFAEPSNKSTPSPNPTIQHQHPKAATPTATMAACAVLPYSSNHYNTLPEFFEAKETFKAKEAAKTIDTILASLFLRHNVHEDLGIQMLHTHFAISDEERLVGIGSVAVPIEIDIIVGSAIKPLVYRLLPTGVAVCEWTQGNDANEVDLSSPHYAAFVAELRTILADAGLTDVLGLFVRQPGDGDMKGVEFTAGRANITLHKDNPTEGGTSVEASWVFHEEVVEPGDVPTRAMSACQSWCQEFVGNHSSRHKEKGGRYTLEVETQGASFKGTGAPVDAATGLLTPTEPASPTEVTAPAYIAAPADAITRAMSA
ncbi:hypothetical protein V494_00170, partial [Pseudogymnoascus sp. VKM F-4513 (FW-928)]